MLINLTIKNYTIISNILLLNLYIYIYNQFLQFNELYFLKKKKKKNLKIYKYIDNYKIIYNICIFTKLIKIHNYK